MNMQLVLRAVRKMIAASAVLAVTSSAYAEAVFDGTLGPGGSLSGTMEITDDFGTQLGDNLFHSFSIFNVNAGESATFTSTFGGITDNVIARVTGGTLSTIDGLLASSIPGADLWLINPSGVVIGDNASLSVPGAFHASTADYLVLEDGARFDASNPPATLLSMADPVAFGFVGPSAESITVGAAVLEVGNGQTLSIVGGDVSMNGSLVSAPAGRINVAGMGSSGEFQLPDPGANRASLSGFGDIAMESSTVSVDGGGDVYILGGQFFAGASLISSSNLGNSDGGNIRIDVDDMTLTDDSGIVTPIFGAGDATSVNVNATGAVSLVPGGASGFGGRIWSIAQTGSTGDAGSISISASDFDMQFSSLVIFQIGDGQAGDLTVDVANSLNVFGNFGSALANNSIDAANAGNVNVTAGDVTFFGGSILVRAFGDGDAGRIAIEADNLSMANGTQFNAGAFGFGTGGEIVVDIADTITMTDDIGFPTAINSGSANGAGGGITVSSRILNIFEGAEITAGSFGGGVAGDIDVVVDDGIFISGRPGVFTGIFSNAFSVGDAGNINIASPRLELSDGGSVQASAFTDSSGDGGSINMDVGELLIGGNNSFITARAFSSGNGGDIVIDAETIRLAGTADSFDGIFAGTQGTGDGGSILINTSSLELLDGAFIQVSTFGDGDAGTIDIKTTGDTTLDAVSDPATGIFNSTFGNGNAGPISIAADNISVSGLASVQAATAGAGSGGAVRIDASNLSLDDGGSVVAVTLGSGNAGTIDIDLSDTLHVSRGDLSQMGFGNIATSTSGIGEGGTISIAADTIIVDEAGVISAAASSDGVGGDVQILGRIIEVSDGGTITANSIGAGNAGTILVIAVDELLVNNASIETSSEQSAGGNINLNVGTNLFLNDNATISAAANGVTPGDDGGNIAIDPVFVVLRESQILASANAGNGGNISIEAGTFIVDANSEIDASSQTGLAGQITIDSVNDVFGSVVLLEAPNVQVSELVTERCVAQAFRDRSSLTVAAADATIWSPDDYAPSPHETQDTGTGLASNMTATDECRISVIVRRDVDAS